MILKAFNNNQAMIPHKIIALIAKLIPNKLPKLDKFEECLNIQSC